MVTPVSVLSLATAVPDYRLDQAEVARRLQKMFPGAFERHPSLADVFPHSGIDQRYSVRPIDWFDTPHDLSERTQAYLDEAGTLFVKATKAALARAGIEPADVDVVVTASSTGIATPTLEARVGPQLGFRQNVNRVPVFGLGCAGGVSGLAIAARLARAEPGQTVLLVAVEVCTLAFRRDRDTESNVIASALFGDGAAAAVLRAGTASGSYLRIGVAAEHTWPGTLDIMGWSVDPLGFGVILSQRLPHFVKKHLADPVRRFMKTVSPDGTQRRFVCHPGSTKVLSAIEAVLGLAEGTLADEREVLRGFGNVSAPSVLFVLERALTRGLAGPAILCALGPGFTASFLAVEAGRG